MAISFTMRPSKIGWTRQLLHTLTPTIGLTRVGNILGDKRGAIEISREGLKLNGEPIKNSRYLAKRLVMHGLEKLEFKEKPGDSGIKTAFRKIIHNKTLASTARALHNHNNLGLYGHKIILAENFTPELLQDLVWANSDALKENIASHPNTPREALLELARVTREELIAFNRIKDSLTPKELSYLSSAFLQFIRAEVASHPNTPREALLKLAKEAEVDVFYWDKYKKVAEVALAAFNNLEDSLTPEELEQLASGNCSSVVLLRIALHLNTPRKTLLKLAEHIDERISRNAFGRIRNSLSPEELTQLASVDYEKVVKFLGSYSKLPRKKLLELAKKYLGKSAQAAFNALGETLTPGELEVLIVDAKSADVVKAAISHPNCPRAILLTLSTKREDKDEYEFFEYARRHEDNPRVTFNQTTQQAFETIQSSLTAEELTQLAFSKSEKVRYAVASDKRTPREVLLKLIKEEISSVAFAAFNNLKDHLTAEDLLTFAIANSHKIMHAIISHPNWPPNILTGTEEYLVEFVARQTYDIEETYTTEKREYVEDDPNYPGAGNGHYITETIEHSRSYYSDAFIDKLCKQVSSEPKILIALRIANPELGEAIVKRIR